MKFEFLISLITYSITFFFLLFLKKIFSKDNMPKVSIYAMLFQTFVILFVILFSNSKIHEQMKNNFFNF